MKIDRSRIIGMYFNVDRVFSNNLPITNLDRFTALPLWEFVEKNKIWMEIIRVVSEKERNYRTLTTRFIRLVDSYNLYGRINVTVKPFPLTIHMRCMGCGLLRVIIYCSGDFSLAEKKIIKRVYVYTRIYIYIIMVIFYNNMWVDNTRKVLILNYYTIITRSVSYYNERLGAQKDCRQRRLPHLTLLLF